MTGEQRRSVQRMQRELDLHAPIEAPRLDALGEGGHEIGKGEPQRTEPPRRAAQKAQSVYVANLPWGTSDDDIRALFGRYGRVHQATIITDRRTGRSRGFGFVDMSRPAARNAVKALHGSALGGRDLTVRFAQPRRARR